MAGQEELGQESQTRRMLGRKSMESEESQVDAEKTGHVENCCPRFLSSQFLQSLSPKEITQRSTLTIN